MWGDVAMDSWEKPTLVRRGQNATSLELELISIEYRTGLPLCPVTAILRYTEAKGSSPRIFFQSSESQPVAKVWFVEQLRGVLSAVGLSPQKYAGHSFCISAATTAALASVKDSTIQTLGRWHSTVFL